MNEKELLSLEIPQEGEDERIGLSYGGSCPRSLAYRRNGYPREPHPALDKTRRFLALQVGWALHHSFRSLIQGLRDVEREVALEVPPGIWVSGHIDGLIPDPETGELRLLEIKTMAPFSWERLNKGGEVEEGYVVQVALYLRALQESGEPIREALFVALNKGDGRLHQRLLSYSPEHAEKGLENLRLALTLPPEEIPRPHAPDEAGRLPWQCVYCDFWRVCWPGARAEQDKNKAVLIV